MEGQQPLQASVVEVAVAAGVGIERRQNAGIALQVLAQGAGVLAAAVLQQPQGQGHQGWTLAAHVHQVAAHHPVAIEQQVVEGLALGRGAGDGPHRIDDAEHRDQRAGAGRQFSQLLPLGPHPQVAVEVEADGAHAGRLQPLDGRHQVAVVHGGAEAAQVVLPDRDHPHGQLGGRGEGPPAQGPVVQSQVESLRQPRLLQHQQGQNRQAVGEEADQNR